MNINKVVVCLVVALSLAFLFSEKFTNNSEANVENLGDSVLAAIDTSNSERDIIQDSNRLASQNTLDVIDEQKQSTSSDYYSDENALVTPDDVLTLAKDNKHIEFETSLIDQLNLSQTRDFLYSLASEGTSSAASVEAMDSISTVAQALADDSKLTIEEVACSSQMCGLLFLASSEDEVVNNLNQLTSEPRLASAVKGGILRVFEKDGENYGMLLSVISDKPIKMK